MTQVQQVWHTEAHT